MEANLRRNIYLHCPQNPFLPGDSNKMWADFSKERLPIHLPYNAQLSVVVPGRSAYLVKSAKFWA